VTQPICCSDDKPLESLDRLPMAYAFSQLSHDAFQLASIQRTWDLKHVQGTGISELLSFGPSPLYRIMSVSYPTSLLTQSKQNIRINARDQTASEAGAACRQQ
jgi:hypothetical protein